jgi:preprotein translocase subunit SecG
MFWFLIGIEIIIAILIIIAVLMQSSKGGGLAGTFGGGQMGTMFGVRRTADFLSKFTSILAAIFITLSLVINIFFLPNRSTPTESVIQRGTSTVPPPIPPQQHQTPTPTQPGN